MSVSELRLTAPEGQLAGLESEPERFDDLYDEDVILSSH